MVVWCLLLALPIYGASSTLVLLLGARHFHQPVSIEAVMSNTAPVLADFRRMVQVATASQPAHAHSLLARHHHAASDASVTAVDAASANDSLSGESGGGSGGSVVQVLALLGGVDHWQAEATSSAWRRAEPGAIDSHDPRRLERPPRT